MASICKGMEDKISQSNAEICRLEVCLAGSEAARNEIASLNKNIQDSSLLSARAADAEAQVAKLQLHLTDFSSQTSTTIKKLENDKAALEVRLVQHCLSCTSLDKP